VRECRIQEFEPAKKGSAAAEATTTAVKIRSSASTKAEIGRFKPGNR